MGQELGRWGRNGCKRSHNICTTGQALEKKDKRRLRLPVMSKSVSRQLVGNLVGLDPPTAHKSDRRRRASLDSFTSLASEVQETNTRKNFPLHYPAISESEMSKR